MRLISQLSLKKQLFGLVGLTLISLVALAVFALNQQRQALEQGRQDQVTALVDAAHGLVSHYDAKVTSGQLSKAQAMAELNALFSKMRFGKDKGFFFISAEDGTELANGGLPELVGKNFWTMQNAAGEYTIQSMHRIAKREQRGYVRQDFPKPGAGPQPQPVLSYFRSIPGWPAVVGTGAYIDDIEVLLSRNTTSLLISISVVMLVITLLSVLICRNILRRVGGEPSYAEHVVSKIAAGDLTSKVEVTNPDSLLGSIASMQGSLQQMIALIQRSASQLTESAHDVSESTDQVRLSSAQQSDSAAAMAAGIEELTVSISHINTNANEAATLARASGQQSANGEEIIQQSVLEIRRIEESVQATSGMIAALDTQVQQISHVMSMIKEIADQTNLLALNASIEAARAGESGRGFAVVADEVRKLAERTTQATNEIGNTIAQIRQESSAANQSMQDAVQRVEVGVARAETARESIHGIRSSAERVIEVANEMASSLQEQSAASQEIAKGVEHIAQMSENNATAARATSEAMHGLEALSTELRASTSRFQR